MRGQATALFERVPPGSFERARAEFAFGAHLRRSGRRTEAAAHLRAACDGFGKLGALPFLERSAQELAACGRSNDALTAQENTVAEAGGGRADQQGDRPAADAQREGRSNITCRTSSPSWGCPRRIALVARLMTATSPGSLEIVAEVQASRAYGGVRAHPCSATSYNQYAGLWALLGIPVAVSAMVGTFVQARGRDQIAHHGRGRTVDQPAHRHGAHLDGDHARLRPPSYLAIQLTDEKGGIADDPLGGLFARLSAEGSAR